ncbi:MAG: TlpA family protein disulfide reductase [Muribaculaceae bacterium]|nr:TlpA family protein disulfide reductase [Muribaculaceae bacterium]
MILKKISTYILISLFLLAVGCVTEKEEPEWYLHPGDTLPQFDVTTIDGRKISSADSYSAELVIVFFNTTCPDCRRELPILQKQYEENMKHPEEEQSIYICISREEGTADVERYWTENNLTLPVSPQSDRRIYSLFASIGIPRIFYAKNGLITKALYPAQ